MLIDLVISIKIILSIFIWIYSTFCLAETTRGAQPRKFRNVFASPRYVSLFLVSPRFGPMSVFHAIVVRRMAKDHLLTNNNPSPNCAIWG